MRHTVISSAQRRCRIITTAMLCAGLLACGGGGDARTAEPPPPVPPPASIEPTLPISGFGVISSEDWTPVAVGKVLQTLALAGHASDQQILTWSEQHPVVAIQEMLTFEPHNLKLSPPSADQTDGLTTRGDELAQLAAFWASDDPANGVPASWRERFDYTRSTGWLEHLWPTVVTVRGLNPFLHKVAYFEANQHMAVNLNVVPVTTLIRYYDDIANALSSGESYDQVLATAARSAAIAHQYGHRTNRFRNNRCLCNEDFAREFYQLFFGITGAQDADYHETVTIKNTAKALTDMRVQLDAQNNPLPELVYGSEEHPQGPLEVLGTQIDGTNARERLSALARLAIEHPESQDALPVLLIRGLADDALDADGEAIVRAAWASMDRKDLLLFLRAYAISPLFHSEKRLRFWTSLERRLLVANRISASNDEIYQRVYSVVGHLLEGVRTFQPANNVFGDQTGTMAADSLDVFRQNYNQTTDRHFGLGRHVFTSDAFDWRKDWRDVLAPAPDGTYPVEALASQLWSRILMDGGKHYGPLERAHLYALLGTDAGLATLLDPDNLDRVYSVSDVTQPDHAARIDALAHVTLDLDASGADVDRLNIRIGQAVNFIAASPYMFFAEGQ